MSKGTAPGVKSADLNDQMIDGYIKASPKPDRLLTITGDVIRIDSGVRLVLCGDVMSGTMMSV